MAAWRMIWAIASIKIDPGREESTQDGVGGWRGLELQDAAESQGHGQKAEVGPRGRGKKGGGGGLFEVSKGGGGGRSGRTRGQLRLQGRLARKLVGCSFGSLEQKGKRQNAAKA